MKETCAPTNEVVVSINKNRKPKFEKGSDACCEYSEECLDSNCRKEMVTKNVMQAIDESHFRYARNIMMLHGIEHSDIEEELETALTNKIVDIVATLDLSKDFCKKIGLEKFKEIVEKEKMVACGHCGKEGKTGEFDFREAANGIFSESNEEGYLWSNDGSEFDTVCHRWTKEPTIKGDVCDDCIKSLREDGSIEIYDNWFFPFVNLYDDITIVHHQSEEGGTIRKEDLNGNELKLNSTWRPWEPGILEKVANNVYHPAENWLFTYFEEKKYLNKEIKNSIESHIAKCQTCRLKLLGMEIEKNS